MMNRKGYVGQYAMEILAAMIFFALTFAILLFITHNQSMKVDATVAADNSEFACRNQLVNLMKFKSGDELFEYKLISSYMDDNDFDNFENKVSNILNKFMPADNWKIDITAGDSAITSFGALNPRRINLNEEELVNCSIYVPLPCKKDASACMTELTLIKKYEN